MPLKKINKHHCAKELSQYMNWTQKDSLAFIEHCFDWIKNTLYNKHKVRLNSIGSFVFNLRKQRRLLHPISGKPMILPPRWAPQFSISTTLSKLINKGELS